MAVEQPLTAFSDQVDDATLKAVDVDAPRIRKLHQALDACAVESGPQRFELARRAAPEQGTGAFYLMGETPSTALAALFAVAPEARTRFATQLSLAADDTPAQGALSLEAVQVTPCEPRAPMDVFLRMLAVSAASPSSLEPLFEDLEAARDSGLIEIDAGGLVLTGKGREMMHSAGPVFDAFDDSQSRIDLHAQEVADGRMSLGQAITALGVELGIPLPLPGQPDRVEEVLATPDAAGRIDTLLFDPLLNAVQATPSSSRSSVMMLALHRRLTEWGLTAQEAESLLRHDIRCLRALGASLSHGAMTLSMAKAIVEEKDATRAVDHAADSVSEALLSALAGSRRDAKAEEGALEATPPVSEETADHVAETHGRFGFLRRLLSVFLLR